MGGGWEAMMTGAVRINLGSGEVKPYPFISKQSDTVLSNAGRNVHFWGRIVHNVVGNAAGLVVGSIVDRAGLREERV